MNRILVVALLALATACSSKDDAPTPPDVNGVYEGTGDGPIDRLELSNGSYAMNMHDGTSNKGKFTLNDAQTRLDLVDEAGAKRSYDFKVLTVGTPTKKATGGALLTKDLVDPGESPVTPGEDPTHQTESPVNSTEDPIKQGDSPVNGQSNVLTCQSNCALTAQVDSQVLKNQSQLLGQ